MLDIFRARARDGKIQGIAPLDECQGQPNGWKGDQERSNSAPNTLELRNGVDIPCSEGHVVTLESSQHTNTGSRKITGEKNNGALTRNPYASRKSSENVELSATGRKIERGRGEGDCGTSHHCLPWMMSYHFHSAV